jgi:hypothetical protein
MGFQVHTEVDWRFTGSYFLHHHGDCAVLGHVVFFFYIVSILFILDVVYLTTIFCVSDYIASNEGMISEWLICKIWKEAVVA